MDDASIASAKPSGAIENDGAGAVEDLRRALQWQQAIFEGSRDAIFLSDEDSRFIAVNRAASELTGYPREELLGLRIPDLHDEVDLEAYRRLHDRIMAGQDALSEAMLRRKDGSKVPTEFSNSCLVLGGKRYMHTVARDLTERRRAQEALQASSDAMAALVKASPVAIVALTPDGTVTTWNAAAEGLFGWTAAEVIGKLLPSVPPGEEEAFAALLREQAAGATLQGREVVRRCKDGALIELSLWTEHLRDASGALVTTFGLLVDLGERKRAERELQNQLGFLQGLADAMPFPVYVKDTQGCFIRTNAVFDEFSGVPRGWSVGKTVFEVTSPELADTFAESDRSLLREGGAHTYEGPFLAADGRAHKVIIRKAAFRGPDGRVGGVVGVIVDVTERERAEGMQRAIHEISEATHQAKDLGDLFALIHSILGRHMEAKNLYIAMHDPGTDLVSFPYFVDEEDQPPRPRRLGRGLTEYVLRTGAPLLATPAVFEELRRRGEVQSEGTPSIDWLGVPLIVGDRAIGALVVQTYTEGVRYGEPEKEILAFVSREVAQAIERKRAEEALRENERKFRTTVESFSEGLALIDEDGLVLEWNPAVERIMGIRREDALGKPLWEV